MSSSKKLIQAAAGSGGSFDVAYSALFQPSNSSMLSKTLSTPTNNRIFTFSGWVKRNTTTNQDQLFASGTGDYNYAFLAIMGDPYFWYIDYNGSNTTSLRTYQRLSFNSTSVWYHFVVAVDTTQATATNRVKIYFDGTQFTNWSPGTLSDYYPAQNYTPRINNTIFHTIGRGAASYATSYANAYYSEFCFIDGQQLAPTDFAESIDGVWTPKNLSGLSFGNNGFYLDFKDSGNMGADASGNGNNWATSGTITQSTVTPTN